MALNFFIFLIIVISLLMTNLEVKERNLSITYKDIPMVVFENSTLYEISKKEVIRIIQSSKALNYKDRDELFDATIIVRNRDKNSSDSISAKHIIKKDRFYKMYQNVYLNRDNTMQLQTNFISYDEKNQIASNDVDFKLIHNNSILTGDSFYFDGINGIIKAKNAHFIIKQEDLNR